MAISTRIDPLDRDVAAIIDEELSPAARSAALAVAALEALVDADAVNTAALGYRVPHDTFVDGTPGRDADVGRVRPDGTVLFAFQLIGDVIQYVDGLLIALSPHRSGRYARSHLFFADDVQADPTAPPPARQYAFVDAVPYARKIERGLSPMAPDGVYEQAALRARSRYGNVTTVRFSYRSLPGGELGEWAAKTSLRSRRGRRRPQQTMDWLTRQPAILIGG